MAEKVTIGNCELVWIYGNKGRHWTEAERKKISEGKRHAV